MSIHVVLADGHTVVRAGLRLLLDAEEGLEVVGEAADTESALRAVLGYKPDVLVLDLNMPGDPAPLDGLPVVRQRSPRTATVILTMEEGPEFALRAFRAGALGYVLKDATHHEFVDAVRRAAVGKTYLTPSMGAKLATAPLESSRHADRLSTREIEVLRLIALGHTNGEIGAQLALSVRTVETHRAHLQQKLGLTNRAELVRYALDHRLLEAR